MTGDIFFWYVFPLIGAAVVFGWIAYDKFKGGNKHNHHLHPGE